MKSKGAVKRILFVMVTSLLVTFFIGQTTKASADLTIEYFAKIYLPPENKITINSANTSNNFGIIDWLPGEEFEILLSQNKQTRAAENIPIDNTPQYLIENLYKQIKIVQKPTNYELQQEILATVVEHNLPIAVLNVWRPHTVIKIKNLSQETWLKNNTVLTSTNFNGDLSFFRDSTWQAPKLIANMTEARVAPEEIATFEFLIDGRGQPRVYDHVYKLLINNQPIHLDAKGALYWLTRVDAYKP